MGPEELFRENLALIDRVIAGVCRRAGLRDADAEDFASVVKLALIENDYTILAAYEGIAPLGAYLTVVVQRLLTRERTRMWGRWNSSAEAQRLGPAAVHLEKLLSRDRRPLEEAIPLVRAVDPSLDQKSVRTLAERLPLRIGRPRLVELPEDAEDFASPDDTDARILEADAQRVSVRAGRIVRELIAAQSLDDRTLLRFHFGGGMSISDIARLLGTPQRPLYRRVEALLREIRQKLEREGLGAAVIGDLISAGASAEVDLGLHAGKSKSGRHTAAVEEVH